MVLGKKRVLKKVAVKSMPAKGKSSTGGLTPLGKRFYKETEKITLKPGVKSVAEKREEMKRKGSFLVRQFSDPRGPIVKDGKPTRLALSAQAWGEAVPKTDAAAKRLAEKGRKLLEQSHTTPSKTAGRVLVR